ncbi:hypothetical protein J2W92_005913 [Rhizobium leguminosarum]|uniref:hypothetical protein n=1 Tax=Rhizobium leguminosarum TaxID=384 RepID=UPI0024B37BF0|nr:hypothetical protein [Rhizobium leguminosarum]WHO84304.1 hypothetical protein QMO81_007257 [Rhizobium leguminosarum]
MGSIALSLPSPLSVLFLLTAVALIVFAVVDIRQSARFADIFLVAERLELSEQISPDTVAKTAAGTDTIVSGDYCRSDIVMAGTTLVLNRLDAANEITGYQAWAKAADDAERYMRHAVSCMPTESNLWLRLAIVRAVIVQEPKSIARLMTMSARLAPVDEVALLARLYFWNRLNITTLDNARTSVESDVNLLLKLGDPRKVGPALTRINAALLPYVKTAGSKLTSERKSSLAWFGVNIDKLP